MKYIKILLILSTLLAVNLLQADEGLTFKAKGKETIEVRFNGRLQAQYDNLSMTSTNNTDHFYFRRLFFGAKAKLSNGFSAETVLDFAGDESPEIAFDKAIIGYTFDNGVKGVLGFQKVPFGFEETTSSSKLPTIERSAINRFFADDIDFSSRHMGLHAKGKLDNGLSYAWAIVNSAQGEGSRLAGASNTINEIATYARLQYKEKNTTLGIDYGNQPGNTTTSKITDSDGFYKGVDYGKKNAVIESNDVNAYTAYLYHKADNFNILGEYFSGDLGSKGDTDGYSIRLSQKNGKWEPVLRFSVVNSDYVVDGDELIRRAPLGGSVKSTGSKIESKYIGLNYYYSKAVTLMGGYEIAELFKEGNKDTHIDGFRARVQVLW